MAIAQAEASGGARILAVDDVEAKRYAWVKILTRAGFHVSTASTGKEALALVKDGPDLVILDVRLPDINGMDVCRQIKAGASTASIPVLHISASLITSEDRAIALESGADGYLIEPVNPDELVASVKALLRMKRAEEKARKAAQAWQLTFDTIQDGIAVIDSEGRVTRCNRAFLTLTGRAMTSLQGAHLHRLLAEDFKVVGADRLTRSSLGDERDSVELRWGDRWIRMTSDPIASDDAPGGSICIFSDVTTRRAAEAEAREGREQLRQINATLEERVLERTERLRTAVRELEGFTYTIAHDLRAPLRAMHRSSEVLLAEYGPKLDCEGQSFARRIIDGAEKMNTLIDDLLAYSRVAQSEIQPQPLPTTEVVEEALRSLLSTSSPPLPEVAVDPGIPEVLGDRVLLHQVVSNLLSNAVKFVFPGTTPRVRVTGERQGNMVLLTVVDNGIGIPKGSMSRLFRIFERLGPAKDYPGTGIGLAIVRRAVERMDGDCGVESWEPCGSRFWVRLPAAPPKSGGRP